MYILAIETTGAYASVAVTDGKKILADIQGNDRFSHLQNLMPQVQKVLDDCSLSLGDMTAIAVSVGPGSFTGIRIGVSSARALAQILHIPCVAVSSLEALSLRVYESYANGSAEGEENVIISAMLDARRNQVFAGAYTIEGLVPKAVVEAGPYGLDEFLDKIREYDNVIFAGDGADSYGGRICEVRGDIKMAAEEARYQHADQVALLGAALYEEGMGVEYGSLQPDYMRIPEAERNLKAKQAAKSGEEK